MVTKSQSKSKASSAQDGAESDVAHPGSVRDSAQQIWQAGLGAFTRAQAEGSKAFEALVKEGVNIQRKTQAAAEERINEATEKMTHMASEISSKATGQWDKLETIFEDRVAKALGKLGVPSAQDVQQLSARIEELTQTVRALSAQVERGAGPAASVAGRQAGAAKKATAKAAVPAAKRTPLAKPTDKL